MSARPPSSRVVTRVWSSEGALVSIGKGYQQHWRSRSKPINSSGVLARNQAGITSSWMNLASERVSPGRQRTG